MALVQQLTAPGRWAQQARMPLPAPKSGQASKTEAVERREAMEAAQGFEAVFVHFLLKAMRNSVPKVGMFGDSFASNMYEQMFDETLSAHVVKSSSLGLSDMVYREWERQDAARKGRPEAALRPDFLAWPAAQKTYRALDRDG
jgi:flagellar protein FlgJ